MNDNAISAESKNREIINKTEEESTNRINNGEMSSHKQDMKRRKRSLSFCSHASVILVPCLKEYEEAGLLNTLWHDKDDLEVYKSQAREELKEFMGSQNCSDLKTALSSLYSTSDDYEDILTK